MIPIPFLPRRRFAVLALAIGMLSAIGAACWVSAADHRDSTALTEDRAADIADVYAFRSPTNPSNVVLVMTVSGLTPPAEAGTIALDPNVLYQFKIDNNGDAVEDLVIQAYAEGQGPSQLVRFRGPARPSTTGTSARILSGSDAARVRLSTPSDAITGTGGGLRVFAGPRDDPFFFDLARFREVVGGQAPAFRNPGIDTFAGTSVIALVVEVPSSMLGASPTLGVWATTSRAQ